MTERFGYPLQGTLVSVSSLGGLLGGSLLQFHPYLKSVGEGVFSVETHEKLSERQTGIKKDTQR
jgi:hypothetical protein